MAFQKGAPANDPLAAALAAAAALARNGGSFLYESPAAVPTTERGMDVPSPSVSSPMRSPSRSPVLISSSNNSDCSEQEHHDDEENNGSHNDIDGASGNEEEDAKRRMARSRERNREHARRTRRRKKAQLEALQSKIQSLQAENKTLKQSLEECRIASILVGFSVSDGDDRDATIQSLLQEANEIEGKEIFKRLIGGKRTRFVSDASDMAGQGVAASMVAGSSVSVPLKIEINGQTAIIGGDGKSHLNWKTGVYTDENGVRSMLTNQQLESLRRERNRMHAKMTRDRKKTFIAAIEKTIEELESSNKRMNAVLAEVICSQKSSMSVNALVSSSEEKPISTPQALQPPGVTPSTSPAIVPKDPWRNKVPELLPPFPLASSTKAAINTLVAPREKLRDNDGSFRFPEKKRVCHGFSLPY